ncbi:MAG: CoB--CoM heterodisulfide reductase iron-sulfur subunit B family protein [Bryobacteraceae bacterium]
MMQSYSYFPGCSLHGTGVAYDESLRALFAALSLELQEIDDWNCCGATSYMSIDEGSAFTLSARNLSIAGQAHNGGLLAPCSACYLALRKTQKYAAAYPDIARKVNAALAEQRLAPLNGVRVRHPIEALYEDVGVERIRRAVKRNWSGPRVACYYGCQIVRPYGEVDRDHNPVRMDELLAAAGVPSVDYALKTKCCGGSLTGTMHDVGVRLNYILLKEALRKGAGAVVTVCPLCQYNLDAYQSEIERQTGEKMNIPVLYFSQVLGWALGADVKTLGLGRSLSGRDTIARCFGTPSGKVEVYV